MITGILLPENYTEQNRDLNTKFFQFQDRIDITGFKPDQYFINKMIRKVI